jgi:hypothetical protein
MTPEEIAEKVITVKRNGDNPQWAIAINGSFLAEDVAGGVMLGGMQNHPDVAGQYAGMIRRVFEDVIRELINECIDAVNTAPGEAATAEAKRAITLAIHKRFSEVVN